MSETYSFSSSINFYGGGGVSNESGRWLHSLHESHGEMHHADDVIVHTGILLHRDVLSVSLVVKHRLVI